MRKIEPEMVQDGSSVVQDGSRPVHGGSKRFKAPHWWEYEAATPVNQRHKGLRITLFIICASGAVVTIYQGWPLTEQALAILSCVLSVLIADPFAALGAVLAKASRVILASVVILIGITTLIPKPGMILLCGLWTLTALTVVKRFNRRYLMQDTFSSARAIPDALRTAPESKAGLAWRHGGAKTVNAMAAEIGGAFNHVEVKAREISFYIGYQTADTKMAELSKRCERLRIENVMLKDAEAEKNELLTEVNEMDQRYKKERETANLERQKLLKKIQWLEDTNAELVRAVPEEVQTDEVESKLEHAFKVLHMSDRDAAEFAGCDKSRAWRYRKDKGIKPKGG